MSTNINAHDLRNFILKNVGRSLDYREAKDLSIEEAYLDATEELDTRDIDIDDVVDNDELYEQFATLFVTEQDKKTEAKDKDKEKEEENKVKDKNQAGV